VVIVLAIVIQKVITFLENLKIIMVKSHSQPISRFLFLVVMLISSVGYAQMDCRSTLGAHLTPFNKEIPILWAIEGTMAPGIMTSPYNSVDFTKLNGGMLLGALDFTIFKKHNFYLEGGYKNWVTSDFVPEISANAIRHIGMRQVFYAFHSNDFKIKAGLHETKLGSFPILDERILGVTVDKNIGAFELNLRGGTVMKNFARMGVFCSNRHLYGIISPNFTENIGKNPGDTNFAGFSINWNPNHKDSQSKLKESDGSFNEFNDMSLEQGVKFNNVQFLVYNEFGSQHFIPKNKLYIGAIADIEMPFGIIVKTGTIYQNMLQNNALIYIAKLERLFTWQNGAGTNLNISYLGKANISENAIYQPLFSNLFLGEIMRLDVFDFPLWTAELNHKFSGKLKLHTGLKMVGQIENQHTNEQDLEIGLTTLKNHLQISIIGSRVQTKLTPEDFYMIRTEIRLAF
jgi:hypothetical protein